MLIISPDEGGMKRAVYYANVLGLDMGMFYKRRDYTRFVDGVNPVLAHEFLGSSVEGKDMIVIDDMLSTGDSILEVASALKKRKARRVFICETFGLFTDGIEKFDKAYAEGKFDKIITTNLIYQKPELQSRPWYVCCSMSKYLAYLIDTLNHDSSISDLLDPRDKILGIVERYNKARAEGKKFK
jgi:ribose-phosphate pyrophosphokinase